MLRLALALVLALASLTACKPSGNDALAEALVLLGEAERGPCTAAFDPVTKQQTIDVARVGECLTLTNAALTKLNEAKQLGVDNGEVDQLIAKTEEEVRRLETLKRMVLRMGHGLDLAKPPAH